jgi:hypothetical protein
MRLSTPCQGKVEKDGKEEENEEGKLELIPSKFVFYDRGIDRWPAPLDSTIGY